MEKLSYLATFVSLVYGLGVANVLAHLASLIKRGRKADWYWVHTVWSLYLMLMMASFWWTLQNWAAVPHIGYLSYLSLLLIPSLLFIASDLLFPERGTGAEVDLRAHFYSIRRPFFLLFIALLASDEIDSLLKGWEHVVALGPYYWGSQVFWYATSLVGMHSASGRVHGVLVCTSLLLFLGGIFNALASV